MLEHHLFEESLPVELFLSELDKQELLFLNFMMFSDNARELSSVLVLSDRNEDFIKTLRKTVGSRFKKMSKEQLTHDLRETFQSLHPKPFEQIYKLTRHDDEPETDSMMLKFLRFVEVMFMQKIDSSVSWIENGEDRTKQFHDIFCYSNRPILNTFGLLMMLGKVHSFEESFSERRFTSLHGYIFESLLVSIVRWKNRLFSDLRESLHKEKTRREQVERKLAQRDQRVAKTQEGLRNANAKLRELQKNLTVAESKTEDLADKELVNRLYEDLRKKDQQIEQMTQDMQKMRDRPSNMYQTMIENLNTQIAQLKVQNGEKSRECRELKRHVQELENKSPMDVLDQYLKSNGFTSKLQLMIEPYFELREESASNELVVAEAEVIREFVRIGYCLIENEKHYVQFPNGKKAELQNLPESLYLSNQQFVKATDDGDFRWAYPFRFEESDKDFTICDFGIVTYRGNEPLLDKGNGRLVSVQRIPQTIQLRDKQVISVDGNDQLLRFYKSLRHNASAFLASIQAKAHQLFYVLKVFPNGILTRNIATSEESFLPHPATEKELQDETVFTVHQNTVVNMFQSKFYTHSSLYDKGEYGMIDVREGKVFLKKLSGEVVIVKDVPSGMDLETGIVVKVDEFNNFLFVKREEISNESRKPDSSSPRRSPSSRERTAVEITKEVLIVGNVSYDYSYKMAMLKQGFRAEVVDGFVSWVKLKSAIRDKDVIVVVTEFVSHENMWNIKEGVKEIPVIYSEFDGANRILDQVLELA